MVLWLLSASIHCPVLRSLSWLKSSRIQAAWVLSAYDNYEFSLDYRAF